MDRCKKLRDFLGQYVKLNDTEWYFCEQFITQTRYVKGETILYAGDVCDKLMFINSGIVRSYMMDFSGNDYTWEIGFNDDNAAITNLFVLDYDSFLTQTPSTFTIEVVEDCEILWISKGTLQKLYSFHKKYEQLGRVLVEYCYIYAQRRLIDMTIKTSMERYVDFVALHEHLLHKVPQYQIASYLKISPQHLSVIKQKIKISE